MPNPNEWQYQYHYYTPEDQDDTWPYSHWGQVPADFRPTPITTGRRPATAKAREEAEGEITGSTSAVEAARDKELMTLFLQQLELLGIDPEDPRVIQILETISILETKGQEFDDIVVGSLLGQAQEAVFGASSYGQALLSSGFIGMEPGQLFREGAAGTPAARLMAEGERAQPFPVTPYERHPQTGWMRFSKGNVLVNPDSAMSPLQRVMFDPKDSTAPGSPGWLNEARRSWGQNPEAMTRWRGKLIELGYLDKQFKGGVWDMMFEQALQDYHINRYLHEGDPVPAVSEPGKVPIFNIRNVQAQVRNDVRDQFVQVFGSLPTDEELEYWTDFVIRTGNKLQRRKDFAPSEATAEAEHRMFEKVAYSPQAMFINESIEENTQLRDALIAAAQATERFLGR